MENIAGNFTSISATVLLCKFAKSAAEKKLSYLTENSEDTALECYKALDEIKVMWVKFSETLRCTGKVHISVSLHISDSPCLKVAELLPHLGS